MALKTAPLLILSLPVLLGLCAHGHGEPTPAPPPDYRIAPGDVLLVRVWNDSRLDGPVAVAADGAFSFPMIGRVKAKGLSPSDLSESLRKRLADGFLKDPHVTVLVTARSPRRVYVLGEVRRPGAVTVQGDVRLAQILALVGGPTEHASGRAVIMRPPPAAPAARRNKPTALRADVRALLGGDPKHNVTIRPGDTIIFPKTAAARPAPRSAAQAFVLVFGAARKPGAIPVHKKIALIEAVAKAGGAAEDASGSVRIIRAPANVRKGEAPIEVELKSVSTGRAGRNVFLANGDVLFFPRRRVRHAYVLGEVKRPGMYSWTPGMTVFEAIMKAGGFTRKAHREAITISRVVRQSVRQVRAKGNTPVEPGDVIKVSEGLL